MITIPQTADEWSLLRSHDEKVQRLAEKMTSSARAAISSNSPHIYFKLMRSARSGNEIRKAGAFDTVVNDKIHVVFRKAWKDLKPNYNNEFSRCYKVCG